MTLQYNVRSMEEDRRWQQRVRLSEHLLLETVDWWCQSESDFPINDTIASVLYLFSPRCNPFTVPDNKVRQHLLGIVETPVVEYSRTWPHRGIGERATLIGAVARLLGDAADQWKDDLLAPPIDSVNQQIVAELISKKYVIFRHHQTTRRDYGGFYGSH